MNCVNFSVYLYKHKGNPISAVQTRLGSPVCLGAFLATLNFFSTSLLPCNCCLKLTCHGSDPSFDKKLLFFFTCPINGLIHWVSYVSEALDILNKGP